MMPPEFNEGGDDSQIPNGQWKKKPITQKQGELLHDLVCEWFSKLNRGQASQLIEMFLSKDENPFTGGRDYDDETLERHK
jgi:hypothetical protein|tara:strand:- start:92 stop:331 length:240 start_codon:yes stop_codon:yes gene_type:complete